MTDSESSEFTDQDLEDKIAKLEANIDQLLQVVETNANQPSPEQTPPQVETVQQDVPPEQSSANQTVNKSKKQVLEDYEKAYLERLANKLKEEIEIQRAAEELVAKRAQSQTAPQVTITHGSMPKGWQP